MEEVGGAPADVGAVVSDVSEQLATIRRAAQGRLVSVQDGDVAAVAGERVKHARAQRGCDPVGKRARQRSLLVLPLSRYSKTTKAILNATHESHDKRNYQEFRQQPHLEHFRLLKIHLIASSLIFGIITLPSNWQKLPV